jgi:nucleotide-binding universal stress UspA family protein
MSAPVTHVARATQDESTGSSIICGVDGSHESRVALRVAAELADQLDLRLVVAHVSQVAVFAPAYGVEPVVEEPSPHDLQLAGELLAHIVHDEGLDDVALRPLAGFPAERLADLADAEEAEFIVVGSRGRGALKAAFLGSVSRDLIGVARCPVVVVPPGAADE